MQDVIERIKQQHAYDAWRGTNTLPENLFVWQFFLLGDEFAAWENESAQRIIAPGQPPLVHSVWKRRGGVLLADIYECASRLAAHEFLLQLLAQFQSPLIQRRQDESFGDVVFGPAAGHRSLREGVSLFTRANLVISIRKGSPGSASVPELAQQLDRHVTAKPEAPTVRAVTAEEPEEAVEISVDETVALSPYLGERLASITAAEQEQMPVTPRVEAPARFYKCFAPDGEVLQEEGQLVYRPSKKGTQTLTVFAVGAGRKAEQQELKFVAT